MPDRLPNHTEVTPKGLRIDYYDSVGLDGKPQRRQYLVNDAKLPSTTKVCGILTEPDGLIASAVILAKRGINYREQWGEAARRGTAAHDLIVKMMAGGASLADLDDEHRAWGEAAAGWLFARDPELLDAERMVATDRFAGRFDLLAKINGAVTRVDFKTVSEWKFDKLKAGRRLKPPFPEAKAQLSGYELAARYSGYEPATRWLIVRLGPDGTYAETEVGYHPDRFLAYLAAYEAKLEDVADLKATTSIEPYPLAEAAAPRAGTPLPLRQPSTGAEATSREAA